MQTEPQIVFKGLDRSDAMESRVRDRLARLDRFGRLTSCRVVIEADHRSAEGFKPPVSIHVEVNIPKHTLVAKETESQRDAKGDGMAFVNRAFDAIQRQMEDEARIMRGDVKHHSDLNGRRLPD